MVMTPATLAATADAVAFGASWCVVVVVPSLELVAGAAGAAAGTSAVTGPVAAAMAAVAGIAINGVIARTNVARFTFLFTLCLHIASSEGPPRSHSLL